MDKWTLFFNSVKLSELTGLKNYNVHILYIDIQIPFA